MQPFTNNAIAWAAFQLQGGWRNISATAIGYGVVVVLILTAAAQFATVPVGSIMYHLLLAMLAAQGLWLLVFAPSRIQAALRRDLTSGMIESHRLMPLSPPRAVFGYLVGPTVQPAALALMTFVVGCFAARGASVELPRWIIANFLVLELAAVAWVVMAAAAMTNAQGGFITLTFILPVAVNTRAMHALPGAVLLVPPFVGKTVFEMAGEITRVHVAGFLLHGVIAAIFLRAAARKYVRSDASAFTPMMGLALLACWSASSIVAMRWWPEVRPAALRWRTYDIDGLTILYTTAAAGLLAIAPVTKSVWPSRERREPRKVAAFAEPISAVLLATAIAMLPAFDAGGDLWRLPRTQALTYTAIPLLATLISVCLLAKAFYLHGLNAWMPIAAWLALICIGPIGHDMAQQALADRTSDFAMAAWSDLSPMGMLHAVWRRGEVPAPLAVVAHAAYVGIAGMILASSLALRGRLYSEAAPRG